MEYKTKNRAWVKNAAIIFLSVLLVLTFFSNTWMNRSLPEVATQNVSSGAITAKVRGTGTVTAVGTHVVKAEQTREIRAVMVKVGQEVKPGDVLFVLGQGEASELENAQEKLRQLELSYQRTAVGIDYPNYGLQEHRIAEAREAEEEARQDYEEVQRKLTEQIPGAMPANARLEEANAEADQMAEVVTEIEAERKEAETILNGELLTLDAIRQSYNEHVDAARGKAEERAQESEAASTAAAQAESERQAAAEELERRNVDYLALLAQYESQGEGGEISEQMLADALDACTAAQTALDEKTNAASNASAAADSAQTEAQNAQDMLDATLAADILVVEQQGKADEAQAAVDEIDIRLEEAKENLRIAVEKRDAIYAAIQELIDQSTVSQLELDAAKKAYNDAVNHRMELEYSLQERRASDARAQTLGYLDLTDLNAQIEAAKKKVADLSGGEANQILARVAGTVKTVECTAGDTKVKNDVLCTIEVPDMGYTLSFSVTNEQARRLKPGDPATVSNYYWGNDIQAKLESIKTDPEKPQTNKLLNFTLEGNVNAGTELTLSVGQKSANYDTVVPKSAIRSDTNGSFVLSVEAKNSPLGNRYVARRVEVSVLAEDDSSAAVTADLGYGAYVITTSSAPVKNGDLVRLADNG